MFISLVETMMDKQTKIFSSIKIVIIAMVAVYFLTGCTSHKALTLMPTPILYQNSSIDPFADQTSAQKSTKTQVFYATNRVPKLSENETGYGNGLDSIIHYGLRAWNQSGFC